MNPASENNNTVQELGETIDNSGNGTVIRPPSNGSIEPAVNEGSEQTVSPLLGDSAAVDTKCESNRDNDSLNSQVASEESKQSSTSTSLPPYPTPPASVSSSSTLTNSDDSRQSSANASVSICPDTAANSPKSEVNSLSAPYVTSDCANIPVSFTVTAQSSASISFSSPAGLHNISDLSASANATMGRGAVRFSNTADVHNADGTTTRQPVNIPASATSQSQSRAPMSSNQNQESRPEAAPGGPPAGSPPTIHPPTPPHASAAAPEPNQNGASSAPPQANHPRVVSHIAPPIGARERAAMANFGNQPVIVLGSVPNQAAPVTSVATTTTTTSQPFLWVNPPMVSPSVPAPRPGNTGSWCYPSQSPFWAGAASYQTVPPPQFYTAEQAFVAEPAYVAAYAGAAPQAPQVQYYVNGSTGPFVYYRG